MRRGNAVAGVRAIILDIEGTTTPISFVHETLFPYARKHLPRYFEAHIATPEGAALIARLRQEHSADRRAGEAVPTWVDQPAGALLASVLSYVEWLMDRDRKSPALKELQGRIWEEGYKTGELWGEVFPDVVPALERWSRHGIGVGIFSSGSVLAQQLLFRNSSSGDLTRFLRWHFDTAVGAKTDAESYRRIARAIGLPPAAVLFVSDVTGELDAARAAGMQTVLSLRPGNAPLAPQGYDTIRSLDELQPRGTRDWSN